jgi:hypothetical protein
VPLCVAVTMPALLIVAFCVVPDVQLTLLVILTSVPSLYEPVAVNDTVFPLFTLGLLGLIEIEFKTATTVKAVEPLTPPRVAVMVTDPPCTPDTKPPLAIVASAVADELQVTLEVRS